MTSPKANDLEPSTRAIHATRTGPRRNRAVTAPIHLSSTFEAEDVDEQIRLEETKADTFYTRYGNPTLSDAERRVASLESSEDAVVFGSGMAAITTTLLSFLEKGDHAIFQYEIYGGAHRFAEWFLPRMGVSVSRVDAADTAGFQSAIRENTRLIYIESPTNPTLRLVDIEAVASIAKDAGVKSFIDSTFATPHNTRPHEKGVDGVLHSATKYYGGHSDLLAGVLAGSKALCDQVRSTLRVTGGNLDPHAAYLLSRGIKTLEMRVERHNDNALAVASFLAEHPKVKAVFYPMHASHEQVELARRQMRGGGGVLSFEVHGGLDEAKRFADHVNLIRVAPSLGGVESLLTIPCVTTHAMLSPGDREKAGIRNSLVRLALGVESAKDLIVDIDQALNSV